MKTWLFSFLLILSYVPSSAQVSADFVASLPTQFRPMNREKITPLEVISFLKGISNRTIRFEANEYIRNEAWSFLSTHFAKNYPIIKDWKLKAIYCFYIGAYLSTIANEEERANTVNKYYSIFERIWAQHPDALDKIGSKFLMLRASILASEISPRLPAALQMMEKSLAISKKIKDTASYPNTYISIAKLYGKLQLFDRALAYQDSSELFPCIGDNCFSYYLNHAIKRFELYFNRFKLLHHQADADSIKAFLPSYQQHLNINNDPIVREIFLTMYAKLSYFEKDYRSCLNYFDTINKIPFNRHSEQLRYEPNPELYIGLSLLKLNRTQAAYKVLNNISDGALTSDEPFLLHEEYQFERSRGNYAKALAFFEAYFELYKKENLLNYQGQILEMEQRFKYADAEQKLSISKAKNEKNIIIGIFSIGILLLILIALAYKYWRNRRTTSALLSKIEEQTNQQIIRLEEAAIIAKEHERQRIGQNIHDNLAGTLAGLLNFIRNKAEKEQNSSDKEQYLVAANMLRDSYNQTRTIAHDAWEQPTNYSFEKVLKDTLTLFFGDTGISVNAEFDTTELETLDINIKTSILLIFKELVTNIIKHAQAKTTEISLYSENNLIHLSVADDGNGLPKFRFKSGMGIQSLKNRVETLGGKFELLANHPKGTIAVIQIPFC